MTSDKEMRFSNGSTIKFANGSEDSERHQGMHSNMYWKEEYVEDGYLLDSVRYALSQRPIPLTRYQRLKAWFKSLV